MLNKNKNIKKNKYQIFICVCPVSLPLSFASHLYIVCNERGRVSRYEVGFIRNKKNHTYLYKNWYSLKEPFRGVEVFPTYRNLWHWKGRVLFEFEGDLAKRMISFVKTTPKIYPYLKRYVLSGPNSNTYVQWVLDHFPETKARLPWNSFGKGYKKRT